MASPNYDFLDYLPEQGNLRGLEGNIDLVDLTAFDVQIALNENQGVEFYDVLKIMTQFMNDEFQSCLASEGTYATFDTVVILRRTQKRQLEMIERELEGENDAVVGELYTAQFQGAALFTRLDNQLPLPSSIVEGCQRQAFLDEDLLLDKLQGSEEEGLGLQVVDVRAYINPTGGNQAVSDGSGTSDSLEVVIIIAIVIACVAFMFLIFAVYWAWRYDKKNRDAYLNASSAKSPGGDTFDDNDSPESKMARAPKNKKQLRPEPKAPTYPSVIGGDSVADGDGVYPESVISDDINSSLTQYYQSGLQNYTAPSNRLQDAGSVSSMESYGYSLDGYAPSLATPMPADGNTILSTGGPDAARRSSTDSVTTDDNDRRKSTASAVNSSRKSDP
mmetsp:Transcript_13195/g.17266  ORF Transcript_13195/g.17266 Transcript_13195/m.17266 type:complete len:389 (+) Transcript_13195:292-1458(+)|eukprot:CAMPEP_0198151542 /NCGR_PEP_ID=MMETSP1443-20131203/55986_1 /TAXON_ID=186043 /ORGANISM="Entomoneis sp., Strain CCMP2396" /LENGTH=388 /DNA_ID=CAMNT_0043817245 /DNA_START=228 /DNA_END=1394 /DNA_ORIENTATION=-